MSAIGWSRCLALLSLLAIEGASASNNGTPLVGKVRAANSRFKDVNVAVVECYAPISCASGVDAGAMGIHYVNAVYLKDEIRDIKRPQAVMYEPLPNGKLVWLQSSTSVSGNQPRWKTSRSTSPTVKTATASSHSTSCTCGLEKANHAVRSGT